VVTVATGEPVPARLSGVKSLNYLNNVHGTIEANLSEADEAFNVQRQGCIAECTAANIFVIKRGELYYAAITAGALRGSRDRSLEIAAELGIKFPFRDRYHRTPFFIADMPFERDCCGVFRDQRRTGG